MSASQAEKADNCSQVEPDDNQKIKKWSFGILNDKQTDEVPGMICVVKDMTRFQLTVV